MVKLIFIFARLKLNAFINITIMRYFYILFIALILLACSEEDPAIDPVIDDTILFLKNEYKNGNLIWNYTYDNSQISSYSTSNNSYDVNIESSGDTIILNYFTQGEVFRTEKLFPVSNSEERFEIIINEILMEYRISTYSSESCGPESTFFYSSTQNPGNPNEFFSWHEEYDYTTVNCSQIISFFDSNNQLSATREVLRDDKNLIPRSGFTLDLDNEAKGNIISIIRMDSQGIIDSINSYESTYIYNSLDYPISEVREYLNGNSAESTFEYYE